MHIVLLKSQTLPKEIPLALGVVTYGEGWKTDLLDLYVIIKYKEKNYES